jgi:hypothetical protein
VLIADLMRVRGFTVLTTQEAGMLGKDDPDQLAFAVSRQAAVLTHNRDDYEELAREYFAAGQTHSGIIIAVRRLPYELSRKVFSVLNAFTADEMENRVCYI